MRGLAGLHQHRVDQSFGGAVESEQGMGSPAAKLHYPGVFVELCVDPSDHVDVGGCRFVGTPERAENIGSQDTRAEVVIGWLRAVPDGCDRRTSAPSLTFNGSSDSQTRRCQKG
ncbi:hypothetical protein [Catellatospora methionotrophica]|uniref:hypothetical protein n=1 Tax=Catellatospora methionotrophica TaxID=121620 RepID=UPI0034052FE4